MSVRRLLGERPAHYSSIKPLLAQRHVGQLIGDLPDDRLRGALVGLRCVRLVVVCSTSANAGPPSNATRA